MNSLRSKLVLGTAQFGQDYGIANSRGVIPEDEVFDILNFARDMRVDTLDTAHQYGRSEEIIGRHCKSNGWNFNTISKLPSRKEHSHQDVTELLNATLASLNTRSIYGYLIHKFNDFMEDEDIWNELVRLKSEGMIEKIGFSLYHPNELQLLLDRGIDFDIIQIPYSVFDRRFEKFFKDLKANDVDIYARSVFLQGLAFLTEDQLYGTLNKASSQIEALRKISREENISINTVCLNYVAGNPSVDKVIIGVDGLDHLRLNIVGFDHFEQLNGFKDIYNDLRIEDEEILIPSNWDIAHENRS